MDYDYWLKQDHSKPLFPDILWQRPEQKALAGKLLIIGGNAHGFAAVAQAYKDALAAGVGECRAILPDTFKKSIGPQINDCVFVPTNQSGGLSKQGINQLKAAAAWADSILFVGDAGRNSETAIVYEQLMAEFAHKQFVITRDAVDLLKSMWPQLVAQSEVTLIVTLAQLQKIFQGIYYPRTILFSMQLTNLAEALHKFTITYPVSLVVFHQNQLLVAKGGQVSSTPWEEPMLIWRGSVAAKAAVYGLQHPKQQFQALTTSLVSSQ